MELDLALGAEKGRRGCKKRKEGEVKREIDRICKKREEGEKGRIKRAAQPPPRSLLTFVIRHPDIKGKKVPTCHGYPLPILVEKYARQIFGDFVTSPS